MFDYYRVGNLCADKVEFQGTQNCCIWYNVDDDEDIGLCFDFCYEDIDDMIALLKILKTSELS